MGAGLPVIGTLKHLVETGDKVEKVEGVFSGTLSYIFNTFGGGRSFSDVVADAKANGYTEPDPRDDLNGTDVARKVRALDGVGADGMRAQRLACGRVRVAAGVREGVHAVVAGVKVQRTQRSVYVPDLMSPGARSQKKWAGGHLSEVLAFQSLLDALPGTWWGAAVLPVPPILGSHWAPTYTRCE